MANEGMSVRQISLTAKWLYIFSLQGVMLEATNNVMMKIPSGFFAFSRDELQQYFSNNYVTIHYYTSDSYFEAFCYDFTINSVNPLSDNITPAILDFSSQMSQQLNQLITMVNSINSGVNLIALNSGATDVDLGNVFAVFDVDKNCFAVYGIPDNLNSYHGVVRFSGLCSVSGSVDGDVCTFNSDSCSLVSSGGLSVSYYWMFGAHSTLSCTNFAIHVPLRFFDSSGSEILGVSLSSPSLPSFTFSLTCSLASANISISDISSLIPVSCSFSNSEFVFSFSDSGDFINDYLVSGSFLNRIVFSIPSDVSISFSLSGS